VHARRLFGKVIARIRIIWGQAANDLHHRAGCPIFSRFPLQEIAQPMATVTGDAPAPVEDLTAAIT